MSSETNDQINAVGAAVGIMYVLIHGFMVLLFLSFGIGIVLALL